MIMRFTGSRLALTAALFALAISCTAFAQQVTYYDFNGPQGNPSQVSQQCTTTAPANALFCFNDGTGAGTSPSFISDTYPAIIDPVGTDNPPVSSTNEAVQMVLPQVTQAASMWFALPQKVSTGFTSWFAFKITPNPNSFATADGIAFVIQNAAGGGTASTCSESGSGLSVVGGNGGCIGYGGIDNSLAIEFDTYRNTWDPDDNGTSDNDNHVAIMNCGAGQPNSPDHTTPCQVSLSVSGALQTALNSSPGVTLADGNVHQVVINYSGPTEANPYLLQIFIDPPFNAGTHTPAAGAIPVLSGVYNIAANVNLINSGSANDSAYVGFTSSTGAAFEEHEIMAWTYTPHSSVTQTQPLSPPGQPTTFPFGTHVYAVTYPEGGPSTAGINMVVTANAVPPQLFSQLITNTPFTGSQCQVYDDTGGNCIIYSVSCENAATNAVTECPSIAQSEAEAILVKSAYNNTMAPVTPGFLQGDPFYSQITSISGAGQVATVTCTGECSVTTGQTVTIVGSSIAGFNGTVTVLAADPAVPNVFTFSTTITGSATGGILTSSNVQNIFLAYSPQRIDATTTGKTQNFSDLVVTSLTTAPTNLTIQSPAVAYGTTAVVTVTATSGNGTPTGNMLLSVDSGTPLSVPLSSAGVAIFDLNGLTGGKHTLNVTYATNGVFLANTASGSITINQATPTVNFTGAPTSAAYGSSFPVTATTNASTTAVITASGSCSILGNIVTMTSGTGTCNLLASWAADQNYTMDSATQSVAALKASSSTTLLTDTPNPSVIQTPVSLTFKVTGNGLPTGTYSVASSVAGDPACSGLLSAGVGRCVLTFLTPGSRTLTITYSGDSNFTGSYTTVQQSVSGAPIATLSATSLNFGTLYLGSVGEQSVTLTNTGSATMTVNEPILFDVGNGDSKEFIALSLCPGTLAIGKSCTIYVAFVAGPSYTTQTAILKIMDNALGSPQSVNLSANVINPQATFSPSSLNLGTQKVGTTAKGSLTLTNTGATPLNITGMSVMGANAGDFNLTQTCPASLGAGNSCILYVSFTPKATGNRAAYINVKDNTYSGSQQITLSGKGD
jgi:hypothetical protein